MLIRYETTKVFSAVAEALKQAVTDNGFGLLQVHNLRETMTKKGVEFNRECLIYEICNPHQAKAVLESDMSMSTVLPCRISLYEDNGVTVMATLKPTLMLSMFNRPDLTPVAQNVEEIINMIMVQAIG